MRVTDLVATDVAYVEHAHAACWLAAVLLALGDVLLDLLLEGLAEFGAYHTAPAVARAVRAHEDVRLRVETRFGARKERVELFAEGLAAWERAQ